MKRERTSFEDELRAVLRRGDPALEDPGPDEADRARMRRAILAGAESAERRAPAVSAPFAVASALVAAAVVAVVMWVEPPGGVSKAGPGGGAPAPPALLREAVPSPPSPAVAALPALPSAGAIPAPRPARESVLAAAVETRTPAAPTVAAEETSRATSVRFTTPHGTQIIWMLDPRVEL